MNITKLFHKNKIIKQRKPQDHLECILKNIVIQLDLPVSFASIENSVKRNPLYPNCKSLSDYLNQWGVTTKPEKVRFQELKSIPTPFLVRTGINRERCNLVTKVNEQYITYIDTHDGLVTCNHYMFEQDWNGFVETFECIPNNREKEFKQSKTLDIKKKVTRFYLISIAFLTFFVCLLRGIRFEIAPNHWVGIYLFDFFGGISAFVVLRNNIVKTSNNDSLDISDSDASKQGQRSIKLFAWYFGGGYISMLLACWTNLLLSVLIIFSYTNWIIVLYSIWQLFKYKKELTSQKTIVIYLTPFVLAAFLFSYTLNSSVPMLGGFILWFISLNVVFLVYIIVEKILFYQLSLTNQIQLLQKIKRPQQVKLLLLNAPSLHVPRTIYNIGFGSENASIQLTLFISPTDAKSGEWMFFFEKLVADVKNIRLNIKILPDNTLSEHFLCFMMTYLSSHSAKESIDILKTWYLDEDKNISALFNRNTVQPNTSTLDSIFAEYRFFLKSTKGITPNTLLINGKVVPEFLNLEDIRYQIEYDPVRINQTIITEKEKFWKNKIPVEI